MTKNLFSIVFDRHSRFTQADYRKNFLERLPQRFLEGSVLANPDLAKSALFLEMKEAIASRGGATLQNPELYPHLNRLLIPNHPFINRHVRAARIHLGLDTLAISDGDTSRFWRFTDPSVEVCQIANEQMQRIEGFSQRSGKDTNFPVVYPPRPQLFDDVERRCYRGQPSRNLEELLPLANEAHALVGEYSPEIAAGFTRTVKVIGFMCRDRAGVKSFSMRNFYVGGIFVSESGLLLLAEQFIHEYYHQCIWPWWLIESPSDLPTNETQIVSPITGRTRPVSVMVHALLIYCSLVDFYRYVLSLPKPRQYDESEIQEAHASLSRIQEGVKPLFTALRAALVGRPKTRSIVETIGEVASL